MIYILLGTLISVILAYAIGYKKGAENEKWKCKREKLYGAAGPNKSNFYDMFK